jgi:hypothetical protein
MPGLQNDRRRIGLAVSDEIGCARAEFLDFQQTECFDRETFTAARHRSARELKLQSCHETARASGSDLACPANRVAVARVEFSGRCSLLLRCRALGR